MQITARMGLPGIGGGRGRGVAAGRGPAGEKPSRRTGAGAGRSVVLPPGRAAAGTVRRAASAAAAGAGAASGRQRGGLPGQVLLRTVSGDPRGHAGTGGAGAARIPLPRPGRPAGRDRARRPGRDSRTLGGSIFPYAGTASGIGTGDVLRPQNRGTVLFAARGQGRAAAPAGGTVL